MAVYTLRIEPTGQAVGIRDDQTLLDGCLRAGIWLPHACCHGLCGTCKVKVLQGEVDLGEASSFALMDFERNDGWALACCARPASDVAFECDVEEEPDAEVHPLRDFTARVAASDRLTTDIKRIVLELDGDGLAFQAGQYITVAIPGVDGPRPFSLANPPSAPNRLELQVRRVPGGAATTYLHEHAAVGDALAIQGPYGRFFVRHSSPQPIVFVAGGSGLSAPKSMVLDLLGKGDARPITLLHAVRTRHDLFDAEIFVALAREHRNLRYVPALSHEPTVSDWDGERGFAHEVLERTLGPALRGHRAYLCGPPPMIDACITSLMKSRVFERDIFHEKFLTVADVAAGRSKSPLFKKI